MGTHDRRIVCAAVALLAISVSANEASAQSACKIPGFDQAAFGDSFVDMGNGCTDSFDSSVPPGTYAGTKCTVAATCVGGVATNGTGTSALTLGPNGCVKGGCTIGAGGSTGDIGRSNLCNGTGTAASNTTLTSVTVPTYPAGVTPGSWAATITPNLTYGNLGSSGNAASILTLNGSGDYVIGNLNIGGQASITLANTTMKAVIYVTGTTLSLSGNGVNNPSANPTNMIFMCADSVTSVSITGNATSAFGLYCPKAAITIAGNGEIFGAVVGKSVTFNGNNTVLHYDKSLGSVTTGSLTCPPIEVSRAQPIISQVTCAAGQCGAAAAGTYDTLFQGTFESTTTTRKTLTNVASVATFSFPWILGHMRARTTASIDAAGASGSGYTSGTILFDAAATGKIPTVVYGGCSTFTGSCRHIFTNTNTTPANGTTRFPTITDFDNGNTNAGIIGPLIASTTDVPGITLAEHKVLIQKILDGKLGGVDRSTVAVIEASSLANASTRPKMVYFGGTDGMLHAVCAEVGGTTPTGANICPAMGTELWAFLPRAQLGLIKTNETRLDGSVHVVDAFGDFSNPQTGNKRWRTILTFQTGYHKANSGSFPAAYAVDITDPAAPKVVWEYTTPTSPGSLDFGTGTDVAAGPSLIGSTRTELAVLETNNGGSGGSGVVTVALDLATGARKWIFDQGLYPAGDGIPATGLPGGAVGVDLNEVGYYSDYIFADLKGRVWRVNASTGVSVTGVSTPLFQFSTLYKPIGGSPALWRISSGGALYLAIASGGYVDQNNTAWMSGAQYIVVAKIKPTGTPPLNETSPALNSDVRIAEQISNGYGAYSSPTVIGDQLFVSADAGNVNAATYGTTTTNTGKVFTVDLGGVAAMTTTVIAGGAAALAQRGTTLYASGNNKTTQFGTATSTSGQSVDTTSFSRTARALWLRTE